LALREAGMIGAAKAAAKEGRGCRQPAWRSRSKTKADKAEIINLSSAWLDHRVANMEEELRRLEKQVAEAHRLIEALDFFRDDAADQGTKTHPCSLVVATSATGSIRQFVSKATRAEPPEWPFDLFSPPSHSA